MGNFNNRRPFSGGQNEYKQMHKAICSNCNKPCEVPFKPNGSKPVLCRDCFRNNNSPYEPGGRTENRSFERRPFDNRNEQSRPSHAPEHQPHREQFDSLHNKLDRIIALLAAQDIKVEPVTPVVKAAEKRTEDVIEEVNLPVVVKEKKKTAKKKSPAKKKSASPC